MKETAYNLCIGDCFHITGSNNNLYCEGRLTTASRMDVVIYSYFVDGKREYGVIESGDEIIKV